MPQNASKARLAKPCARQLKEAAEAAATELQKLWPTRRKEIAAERDLQRPGGGRHGGVVAVDASRRHGSAHTAEERTESRVQPTMPRVDTINFTGIHPAIREDEGRRCSEIAPHLILTSR